MQDHHVKRNFMRWKLNSNTYRVEKGKIKPEKEEVHIKYMDGEHLSNLLSFLKNTKITFICGYPTDEWVIVISNEIEYRKQLIHKMHKEFPYNSILKLITQHEK